MITATLHSNTGFLTTVNTGEHIQILDEPVSLGGNNQGPTPIQSTYAALASCICMTMRIYADRKKFPVESIKVEIRAEKKAITKDDELLAGKEHMIDKGKVRFIHADILVSGKLSMEQIKKLDVIAGKCPVHKMLKHGSVITHKTTMAEISDTQELD